MLRNKELTGPLAATLALTAAAGFVCGALGGLAAGLAGAVFAALVGVVWLAVTARRYARLRQLGEYLASVYAGGELLDIRDNREGELSLLKNDLHKITVTLRQQSEQLAHDKRWAVFHTSCAPRSPGCWSWPICWPGRICQTKSGPSSPASSPPSWSGCSGCWSGCSPSPGWMRAAW